jgi:4-amino-4-deoxy-L-arabinose transferase-like glycosyltransferase
MPGKNPTLLVLLAATASLAVGFSHTPLWDEDEPRFAAIARGMVESGDWVVPIYNDTLAVDKPVLMHWCMAAAMTLFGTNEFASRLPSALATLVTALALLRAGTRWFDQTTGIVAALAFVGCLMVGIEAHAATPDAILVALTAWATILAAEPFMAALPRGFARGAARAAADFPRLSVPRAAAIGCLTGLAVVCKGPVGFVGPLAVVVPWVWWLAVDRRRAAAAPGRTFRESLLDVALPATLDVLRSLRPITLTLAMLAAAAPWYVAVSLRTGGEWTAGFFFVHNVGRFMAPMEKHGGSVFFHPLTMLVGFYPWSCFLPLAIVLGAWRVWKRVEPPATSAALGLALIWFTVWVGGFSAAATKLPNYVLPAYPAAAFLVAVLGVEAARRAAADGWAHPWWMASGVAWLAFGGLATAVTVLVAVRHGLVGAESAALVGLVPIGGAIACAWLARRSPHGAIAAFVLTGLIYAALAVGPAGRRLAEANSLPAFVREMQARGGGSARLGTYLIGSPNVVFYSNGHVKQFVMEHDADAPRFLHSGTDAVLLVPEDHYAAIADSLPEGFGIVSRVRPLFRQHDVLAIGAVDPSPRAATDSPRPRTAAAPEVTR